MIAFNKLINMILGIFAVVIVIVLVFSLFNNYIRPELDKLAFNKLPAGVRQQVDASWNNLIANITACGKIIDNDCICGGFSNFPATFSLDFKIRIVEEKITLLYKSANVKEAQLWNEGILYFKGAKYSAALDKISIDPRRSEHIGDIDFKGVSVDKKTYPFFISSKYPILTDKFYITAPKEVAFVYALSSSKLPEQEGNVTSRPSCLQWRRSAIPKFNNFTACVNSNKLNQNCQFSVKDAGNYRVFIGAGNAYLKYNQDSVKDYDSSAKKSVDIFASVPISCETQFSIENGDSVKIAQKDAKFCLQKV